MYTDLANIHVDDANSSVAVVLAFLSTDRMEKRNIDAVESLLDMGFQNVVLVVLKRITNMLTFRPFDNKELHIRSGVDVRDESKTKDREVVSLAWNLPGKIVDHPINEKALDQLFTLLDKAMRSQPLVKQEVVIAPSATVIQRPIVPIIELPSPSGPSFPPRKDLTEQQLLQVSNTTIVHADVACRFF